MTSCKLIVYYPGDFRIFSGTLLCADPLQVSLQGFDKTDIEPAISMKLKWHVDNSPCLATVSFVSATDDVINLNLISSTQPDNDDSHFIEFKNYIDIVNAPLESIGDLRHRADQINNRHRSSLGTQIKKIITDETLTNQYLFKLLLQVDSKLDELLDNIKQEDIIEGLKQRKTLSLGGGGITFVYEEDDIAIGDSVYVQALPKNGLGLNFAAICKVRDIIAVPNGSICEADFDYIDESTRETIIHFIFQKDREKLKRNKI
ncbi:MAG: hypothetical protein C0603_08365 [Denitrovibrio sp.]|nr:MAG: hypothetical protein C0603_08365 [Denitrovibrio sp.]